jgi:hypothetical protein
MLVKSVQNTMMKQAKVQKTGKMSFLPAALERQ